jgi:DNA-binding transcriptional MerR regulator
MYTTKHAQILYRVASPQTIRNWAKEFEEYLSPTATPEKGNTRLFTIDDMRVFSLIAEYSNINKSFTDIHIALKAGERGDAPRIQPEDLDSVAAGEVEIQLSTELNETRELANRLQEELNLMKSQFQPVREENIRLQAQIEDRERQLSETKQQLKEAQERIAKLAEEKGDAYVRGIMDAMKQQGKLGNNSE